jgi:transcriptional regulator
MYIPRRYEEKDKPAILDFIRAHSFGILISVSGGIPVGTHIPLLLSEDADGQTILLGHISKGNEQKDSLVDGTAVLAIFQGPHAYISPRWYTELNVPTWNYLAVHAYGTLSLMEGEDLKKALSRMVDHYEQGMPNPMKMEEIPERTFQDDFRGIVGFSIRITELQAAAKLSQNRNDESYHNVVQQLEASGNSDAIGVAEAMRQRKPKTT